MHGKSITIYHTLIPATTLGFGYTRHKRVVGFMAPGSLSTWMQRSGRAGRSGSSAISVLLVEPSVFQLEHVEDEVDSDCEVFDHDDQVQDEDSPNKNASQLYDVDLRYRKKLEGGLRKWIDPQDCNCRRQVSKAYFGNPPSPAGTCSWA